jgi:site-specific DNA-methyltransferase (adenine-specific)
MKTEPKSEVFNADCIEIMKTYPDKHFDWAICDVPYGIDLGNMAFLKEMKTAVRQKNGTKINGNRKKKPYTQKDWDKQPPPQAYFDELRRISKEQIIFGADYAKWERMGKGRIKWDKGFSEDVSFNRFEYAYCSSIDYEMTLPLLWAGMCQAKSLSEPMTQQGNKQLNEPRIHPCHKPIMLYDLIFKTFGIRNMKVIDTHLGGGSIRITADKFNCDFTGIEIDKEYFEQADLRFRRFKSQLTIF